MVEIHSCLRCLKLVGALWVTLWSSSSANAQALMGDPRLLIRGPEGQLVYVTVQYFSNGQLAKTTTSRIEIQADAEPEKLDFGHDGIRLLAIVPTKHPVTVTLLDGEQERATRQSQAIGTLEISLGRTANEPPPPLRVLPVDEEKALIRRFLKALLAADTRELVSPLSVANIDWQTLDAYCQAVVDELGDALPDNQELDGWLSWEGSLGARVLAGHFRFEHGQCGFTLMLIDGKLVDVLATSAEMPDEWFDGPNSQEKYIADAERLARLLFTGAIADAHQLFARRYHGEITPQVLQELSDTLRGQLGDGVQGVELKTTELGPYDAESRSRKLSIYHTLSLDTGKRCVSRVETVFPCGRNIIARGNLASIHVRETWQSAHPDQATLAQSALRSLVFDQDLESFIAILHPEVVEILDRPRLAKTAERLPRDFGGRIGTPDWDLWRTNVAGHHSFAEGTLELSQGQVEARFDFADEKLLGVTLVGPSAAFSTLDLVRDARQAESVGREFWERLLRGDLAGAHQQLAPVFQEQMPLEKFEELIQNSGFRDLPKLKAVTPAGVRLADRLDRSLPVMIAGYYLAEFEEGAVQPLRCEFRHGQAVPDNRERLDSLELLNFNSEFTATFPVADPRPLQALVAAFQSGESEQVLKLLNERDRLMVEPILLDGFLQKLGQVAGKLISPPTSRGIHRYIEGSRTEHLHGLLHTENTPPIPLTARFQYGKLKSFVLSSPKLAYFMDQVQDEECLKKAAVTFAEQWMTGDTDAGLEMMIDELRTAEVTEQLQRLREQLVSRHGAFQQASVDELVVSDEHNTARGKLTIAFANGSQKVSIDLSVDAFAAHISGVEMD